MEAATEGIIRKYNFLTIEDNNKAFREELEYFGENVIPKSLDMNHQRNRITLY
jgi:hypothetical protein